MRAAKRVDARRVSAFPSVPVQCQMTLKAGRLNIGYFSRMLRGDLVV
jgi:hypothetical protein